MSQDLEQKLFQQQEILLYIAGRINKRSSDRIIIEVSALLENYDRPTDRPAIKPANRGFIGKLHFQKNLQMRPLLQM